MQISSSSLRSFLPVNQDQFALLEPTGGFKDYQVFQLYHQNTVKVQQESHT